MKQLVFVGNHKNFNALRLAEQLAQVLQNGGQEIIVGGVRGKLPEQMPFATLTLGATASAKSWAVALQKAGVKRVISLGSLLICEAAAAAKLPYLYVEPENLKEEKPVKNKKTILNKAKKVIVLGEGNKALDKKQYGSNAVRVKNPAVWVTHGLGNWPQAFKKSNNIVAAGTLGKKGGIEGLLQVWARLAPLHSSWHLTICADGTGKAALQRFIAKHNLQDSTEFLPASQLRPLLAYADIYVHPALETAGLESVLDAMASKLPVLACEASGADAFIADNVNGKLAQVDSWEGALDELMVDWGKRVGLAVEAAKMKDRFPFEVFASFFEEA